MGRELKRVPLDFRWPIKQIWKGYINPYNYTPCPFCNKSGNSQEMSDKIDIIMNRHYIIEKEYEFLSKESSYNLKGLSLREINRVLSDSQNKETKTLASYKINGQNGWIDKSIISYVLAREELEKAGIETECEESHGTGIMFPSDEFYELFDNWERVEPPVGHGYQLWESTSEGSHISPVFETLEELAEYAESNCTIFGYTKLSKERWMKIFKENEDTLYYEEKLNDKTNVVFI